MRCWGVSRRLNAVEMERDALAFLASHYDGRHLDVMTAQLGLSNVAQRLIVPHL